MSLLRVVLRIVIQKDCEMAKTEQQGKSLAEPQQCGLLRVGDLIVMNSRPCTIVKATLLKKRDERHLQVELVGLDVITRTKLEGTFPSLYKMQVPTVNHTEYPLQDITEDGVLILLSADGTIKKDIRLFQSEMLDSLRQTLLEREEHIFVTVITALDEEAVVDFRVRSEKECRRRYSFPQL